jgi:2-C-methyl-D-erythritol 4-phosphate cytidylyltransferase
MAAGHNKALLDLAGRPLLLYSLDTLRAACQRVLVVAAESDLSYVRRLLPEGVLLAAGGATRHGSEWNALRALQPLVNDSDVIAIHDAARPLVGREDVAAVLDAADMTGAAMLASPAECPALEVTGERVRRAWPAGILWRAQTPQAAHAAWLFDAYEQAAADGFEGTDTTSVLARAGYLVAIVPASADNPKITVPSDLILAETLLERSS